MRTYVGTDCKVLVSISCNNCGGEVAVRQGIAREGSMSISYLWDYFSEKDSELHNFDLCEECYDKITGQFVIPVEVNDKVIMF